MELEQLKEYFIKAKEFENRGSVSQVIDNYYGLSELVLRKEHEIALGLEIGQAGKDYILKQLADMGYTFKMAEEYCQEEKKKNGYIDAYYDFLRIEAPYMLDSYKLYIEKDRPRKQRFYEPRRDTLIRITNAIQRFENDELDILFLHQPPRTGKSQDLTMDTVWHCCRNTEPSNLYVTYKEGLGGAFLDGVTEILTDPTYCHKDIFPNVRITETDAKNNKLDLGTDKKRKKKYKTLSGKGLESGLNGEYDAESWLILDDLLEGVQDVLSEEVLKRKQTIFDNNVLSRAKENCKIICMGTLWSDKDLFSNFYEFIQTSPEMKDKRVEVIKTPALNEKDESNFDYDYGVGFSTKFYAAKRAKFESNDDMVGWSSQYQQEPIPREGAVFHPEHMNYYKTLPEDIKPLKVIGHGDTALGGGDYVCFPVAYYYEMPDGTLRGYVEDVVFDNSEKKITEPQVATKIKQHRIRNAHFEQNQGGESYAEDVEKLVRDDISYKEPLNITCDWALTTKRKDQRIWDNAEEIRQLYFKIPECRDVQYRKFMQNLFSFTMGKNKKKHDDAADALAGLVEFDKSGSGVGTATISGSWI